MDELETQYFSISEAEVERFKRLDAYLADQIPELSRTLIKKLFEAGHFSSKSKLELKKMPKAGTEIRFKLPEVESTNLKAQNIPLDILFEDEHLIIINKPAGMVVHPAPGHPDETLVNAILYHCQDLKGIGNEKRPGIVHRLDKGTSGIMVVAKSQKTHEALVTLFSKHDIKRQYQAIALGSRLPTTEKLVSTIGRSPYNRLKMASQVKHGKNAVTYLETQEVFKHFTHVQLSLETGRTHQIRVHLAELLNAPILNDLTYGRNKEEQHLLGPKVKSLIKNYEHPFLHAKVLGFTHPITQEELFFTQGPPKIFQNVLEQLRSEL